MQISKFHKNFCDIMRAVFKKAEKLREKLLQCDRRKSSSVETGKDTSTGEFIRAGVGLYKVMKLVLKWKSQESRNQIMNMNHFVPSLYKDES